MVLGMSLMELWKVVNAEMFSERCYDQSYKIRQSVGVVLVLET